MKRFTIMILALAMAAPLALPRAAYAWPEPIEKLGDALSKGDVQAALSVFTDDAVVVIPSALVSPRLRSEPQSGDNTADSDALSLAGKKRISAWLDEFLVQEHGVLVMNGPAEMNGDIVSTSYASYWDDNTRRIDQSGASAAVDVQIQGDKIKGFWLKLRGELLTKLEAARTQAASQTPQGGNKQDTANTAGTASRSGSAAKSVTDTLGEYAWVAVPGAVALLAVFGLWLPRRSLGRRESEERD